MTDPPTEIDSHPFAPVEHDGKQDEKGWSEESEPLAAATRLEATISIHLDPDSAALVRQAARRLGLTRSEFLKRAAIRAASEVDRRAQP